MTPGRSAVVVASLLAVGVSRAPAQGVVRVVGAPRRTASARVLESLLAGGVARIPADTGRVTLRRDTLYATTVLVLGGDAVVDGRVRGDVVVIHGDLYLHPGADIAGHAVAVGGGVYNSSLARVRDGVVSWSDHTYDVRTRGDTTILAYRELPAGREPLVALNGFYGVGIPGYDRVDGLVVPFGPVVTLDSGRVQVTPTASYRSDLGAIDPSVDVVVTPAPGTTLALSTGRATMTNDTWIRSDLVNSATTLVSGTDVRNYYRADRAALTLSRTFDLPLGDVEPLLGVLTEDARSVDPTPLSMSRAWTLFDRDNRQRILRPNPPVLRGRISSAVAGARTSLASQGVAFEGEIRVEVPFAVPGSAHFVQSTLNATLGFPTFGSQSFEVRSHAVVTAGGPAPPQRFAYLGGTGTLPTFELLQFGGDQLIFGEGRYLIPFERIHVPVAGPPVITLRYIVGAAGVRTLPRLEQNIGLGAAVSLVEAELLVEPVSRTRQFRVGFSLTR